MDEIIKFSFIIPYYHPYCYFFSLCLNSIQNQKYRNFEILIAYDKELPSIPNDIIDKTKMFCCPNDICGKRNFLLQNATGDYVIFVDCDDMISSNLLTKAFNIININNPDSIIFQTTRDEELFSKQNVPSPSGFLLNKEKLNIYFVSRYTTIPITYGNHILDAVWGKIFKKSIIISNSISFKTPSCRAEDALFSNQFYFKSNDIYVDFEYGYFWRKNTQSAMHKITSCFFNINPFVTEIYSTILPINPETINYLINLINGQINFIVGEFNNYSISKCYKSIRLTLPHFSITKKLFNKKIYKLNRSYILLKMNLYFCFIIYQQFKNLLLKNKNTTGGGGNNL